MGDERYQSSYSSGIGGFSLIFIGSMVSGLLFPLSGSCHALLNPVIGVPAPEFTNIKLVEDQKQFLLAQENDGADSGDSLDDESLTEGMGSFDASDEGVAADEKQAADDNSKDTREADTASSEFPDSPGGLDLPADTGMSAEDAGLTGDISEDQD